MAFNFEYRISNVDIRMILAATVGLGAEVVAGGRQAVELNDVASVNVAARDGTIFL